jgi:hypothetical protein
MTTKTRGYTCYVSGCTLPTHTIGGVCEQHGAEFRAIWKDEHTRKPGDTRRGWLIGDRATVTLKGTTYQATILDMSDRADGDYLWTKLELTKTVTGLDGKPYTSTWEHPEPVQSYKLKKPLLKD